MIAGEIDIGHDLFDVVSLRGEHVMRGAIKVDRSAHRVEFDKAVLKVVKQRPR